MRASFIFTVGFVYVVSCLALDCPMCNKSLCKEPEECRLGKTLDVCGCCNVCFRGIGEECGGPWNVFGQCARHLSCIRLPEPKNEDPVNEFNSKGKCLALPA